MIPNEVNDILLKLENNGFEAYLVGGFVRDYLLNRNTNDFDIATNALPKDLINLFGKSNVNNLYGSYNLKTHGLNIDITTYRREGTYENRKPVVTYTNNLIEDAKRRDFTINALYMSRNLVTIDLFGGEQDISQKLIRMIGNPRIRIQEDPLRILRAIRFAAKYDFKLDKSLANAIKKEKKLLKTLSLERIKSELDSILLSDGFSLLAKLNLLDVLGINAKNIVYVEDLNGLWAQLKMSIDYPLEKNFKNRQKKIEELLKCGTISMLNLYYYGYYDARVCAIILGQPLDELEKMESKLPIHSFKDIVLSSEEIAKISGLQGEYLGTLLKEIEIKIVNLELQNDKQEIEKYIKGR